MSAIPAKPQEIEYIPVEQAGIPAGQTARYRPAHLFGQGDGQQSASAEITLYGIRDSNTYCVKLSVSAPTAAQALDNLMSGIREAKRLYALSPIQPDIKNPKPIE